MKLMPALIIGTAVLAGCSTIPKSTFVASADLKPTQGNAVSGVVSFAQRDDKVFIEGHFKGLKPGAHGFHIHEKGDCSAPDGTSAGGHFNPSDQAHGDPLGAMRHGGDMGNLMADASGNAVFNLTMPTEHISLTKGAKNDIDGRSLIVHADPDDFKTQPTGNSGKRIACGVIRLK